MLSRLAVTLRKGKGVPLPRVGPAPQPELILFEYEGSPWCRRVREHLCALSLSVQIHPCPRSKFVSHLGPPFQQEGAEGGRFRPMVRDLGGKMLFPFLLDMSAGVTLQDSSEIVRHLWTHYGAGIDAKYHPGISYSFTEDIGTGRCHLGTFLIPIDGKLLTEDPGVVLHPVSPLDAYLDTPRLIAASVCRGWPSAGVMLTPAVDQPISTLAHLGLELHSNESCFSARMVREALCTLQLPYKYVPTMGSANKLRLVDNISRPGGRPEHIEISLPIQAVDYLYRRYNPTGATALNYFH